LGSLIRHSSFGFSHSLACAHRSANLDVHDHLLY
jgi:hypothetical protein